MRWNQKLAAMMLILLPALAVHAEAPFPADDVPPQYNAQQYNPQQYGSQQYVTEIGNDTAPSLSEPAPFAVKDAGTMPTAPAQPSSSAGQQPASQMIGPRTVPGSVPRNGVQSAHSKPGVQTASKPSPGTAEAEALSGAESVVPTSPVDAKNVKVLELSPIERAMTEPDIGTYKFSPQRFRVQNLRQFGYSFFRSEARGFAPLTDIPVGPDYVLGAGDHIALTVWGSIEGHYDLEVSRSGEIVLPKVGAVKVAGVTYGQLPKFLNGQLAKVFRDFQLNVTMGKLRLIKVYLVGEVNAPGDYNVSSLSTLINALSAAGGPTRNGSLRAIAIKREGKLVDTIDLYDFFLKGDKSRDIRLQPGDTVFVPSIGPVAGIAGNVRRPAIYELKNEKTLKELLDLADGIVPTGYLQRLQISRVEAHDKKVVTDVNLDTKEGKTLEDRAASIPIKDQDLVKIFPIDRKLRDYVRLEGYVLRPGDYALQPGMRIHQLLPHDNILPETSMEVGEITRLYPPDLHPEKIVFHPGRALTGAPADDLELQEFDQVRIFSRWELEEMPTVRVLGEVQKPGEYRLMKNMRVTDLLISGGYPKNNAYLKSAEITRLKQTANNVTSFPILIDLEEAIKGNSQHNIPLEPFDELTVRKIPNWSEVAERYVTLKGEFRFPGVYPIFKGEKLSSVIRRAGGYSERAYLRAAKFTRESVREIQQKRMDEFIATTEQDMNRRMTEVASAASSPEELASAKAVLEGVKSNLQLLKAAKAEGRLVIKLAPLDKFTNSTYDIAAMGGDVLEVPQRSYSVSVLGKVVNPTNFVANFGRPVGYYLQNAGGTTSDSDEDEIYVIRADGSVFSRQQYSSFSSVFGGGFMSEPVESGDAIVVPQKFEKTAWLRTIKDITTIMSQIAITAGTVFLGLR